MLDAREPGELLAHAMVTSVHRSREDYPLEALFVAGDELFEYSFRPEDGLGNGVGAPPPNMRRVQSGAFGGPEAYSCSSCHFLGGPDGAGTNTQNAFFRSDGDRTVSADQRNPPHLLGLGPIEALAREMTDELRAQRDALEPGQSVVLVARGVEFGTLSRDADGALDTSGIDGVDPDLIVRPFGWKGHQATIRGIAEESFRIHLGIVSTNLQRKVRDGLLDGAALGGGPWDDVDDDGKSVELDDGMLTTIVAYLAQLEVPILRPPQTARLQEAFARGRAHFEAVGCASCHVPTLELTKPLIPLDETRTVDVARDGEHPKPEPKDGQHTAFFVHAFTDLKRHDMGEGLATPAAQSHIGAREFVTRPLWGLADTAPYLHDGRAPTVDDAIRAHGGEADESREKYLALTVEERGALQVYLLCLTRNPGLFVP